MRPRIMIIDDEPSLCKAMVNFLDDFDEFDIRWAHSAEEGLRQLRHEPADLCVVDLRLPQMNGLELVKILVAEHLCGRYIIQTASLDFMPSDEYLAWGITPTDIFYKPTQNTHFLEKIRSIFDGTPRQSGAA